MENDGRRKFHLRLLQSWQLNCDNGQIRVAARQQRLITALAVTGPRPRSYLVGLLWPDATEARALESLRVSMHLVSRQVPGLLLNAGTMLSLSDQVEVDLHTVRARLQDISVGRLDGNVAACLHLLRNAELLPGWYEEWVLMEQSRLRQERLHVFTAMARQALERGDDESASEAAEAALEVEPLHESAVALLIQAERRQGNFASALRAFAQYQARLKEDMGLTPSENVMRLAADIRDNYAHHGGSTWRIPKTREGHLIPSSAHRHGLHPHRQFVVRTPHGNPPSGPLIQSSAPAGQPGPDGSDAR